MADKVMSPIHPGEVLREEFMEPLQISGYRLAKDIAIPEQRIGEIVRERRGITADTALRLSRYFGMSESFFTNMQARYERELVKDKAGDEIGRIQPLSPA